MTRDDILRMAREADEWAEHETSPGEFHPDRHDIRDLRFAALVAAAERERIAALLEDAVVRANVEVKVGDEVAAAIRARGGDK